MRLETCVFIGVLTGQHQRSDSQSPWQDRHFARPHALFNGEAIAMGIVARSPLGSGLAPCLGSNDTARGQWCVVNRVPHQLARQRPLSRSTTSAQHVAGCLV